MHVHAAVESTKSTTDKVRLSLLSSNDLSDTITATLPLHVELRSPSPKLARLSPTQWVCYFVKKLAPFAVILGLILILLTSYRAPSLDWLDRGRLYGGRGLKGMDGAGGGGAGGRQLGDDGPTIIVITPTHKRAERLADMTRFSQTLMHIRNLHWVVVEDANATVPAVERILQRSGLPYTYFHATTEPGMPKRGWTHRNRALQYVRENYKDYPKGAVVYFGDDDNAYDIRLFDKYIRKVKRLGLWAVGLSGAALVEAPRVANRTIVGWDVIYSPSRSFATDMAGFALNLKEILRVPNAGFLKECAKKAPEPCFLSQFGIKKEEAEPFGYEDDPKEILVWHTKTRNTGTRGERHGYVVE